MRLKNWPRGRQEAEEAKEALLQASQDQKEDPGTIGTATKWDGIMGSEFSSVYLPIHSYLCLHILTLFSSTSLKASSRQLLQKQAEVLTLTFILFLSKWGLELMT